MQQRRSETVTLDDIVITEELPRRSPRSPNWQAEALAMQTLARQLLNQPEIMLQTLVDMALDLCTAGSAGVSLLETTTDGLEVFSQNVLGGALKQNVGSTIKRKESPCAVCLARGTPVLFSHLERYFTYFQAVNTPIVEGLVLPLIADNRALGTIWIMSHEEQRHFDCEDVRVMTSLADFTATALLLKQRQTGELPAANAAKTAEIVECRQAEERLRALISNLPGGAAFVVDRDLRYLLAEGEALALAGFRPEDLVGHTIFEVLPPALARYYEPMYRAALGGETFEHEHNAHEHFYISRGTPLRSANGEVYAVLAVSYDITDRKRVEADAAADLQDTQRLRELGARLVAFDDIQTLYQEIVATAIALTRSDAGTVQILDEATQDFLVLAAQGFEQNMVDRFYRVKPGSNTSCGMALATGDRAIIDFDVPESEDPDGSMQLHLEAGYLTAQSTPLISRSGKTIGMVSTHWRNHHRSTERELRFLDLLARQAADLIEQRQAQIAVRKSEEKYRTLFDLIDEGFCIIERVSDEPLDFRYLEANPAFAAQSGIQNVVGKTLRQVVPGEPEEWFEIYDRVLRSGSPQRFERVLETLGRVLELYAFPVADGGKRLAAIFKDITERKLTEEKLRRAAELDAFRVELNDALRSLHDPFEIQAAATRVLAEYLRVEMALYAEISDDGETIHIADSYARGSIPKWTGDLKIADFDELAMKLRAGETLVIEDVNRAAEITETQLPAYLQLHHIATVVVPLIEDGRWVSSLNVYHGSPHKWTPEEITIVQETAERTWAAVERAKAEAALRMNEKRTRIQKEAFQSAINGEPLASSLNILTRIVKEQLGSDVRTAFYLAYPDGASLYAIDGAGDMPQTYTGPLDGFPIGEESFCSGYAIATGRPALTRDVSEDPVWQPYLHLASAHNFRSCGSYPILTREGRAVGSFAMYFTQVHEATRQESAVADAVTQAAAIILSRHTQVLERARAEEALRNSEAKYRSLFDSIDAGFCIFEMLYNDAGEAIDFRYIETNPAFERQSGRRPQPGQTMRELFPETEDMWLNDYAEVARTGQSKRFIDFHQELDRWFDVFVFPTSNGRNQLAALFSDVTVEKRAEVALRANEERQAFLLKLSDILQRFVQPNDIKAAAMRLLGEHLGVSRAQYHECDSSGEYYDADGIGYANGVPLLKQKYRIDDFGTFVSEDFAAGRPYRIDDLAVDARISPEERDAYRTYQIRAGAGVPLLRGGKLVAILAIHDVHPHQWTDLEMDLIRETAERIWTPVERARAKEALRESEAKYRTLFASIDEGFALAEVIYDPSGQPVDILYLEANPAASRLTGVPDYTQRRMSEILPNMEPYWVELYDRVARTGVSERAEQYTAPLDRWYDFYVFRIEVAEPSESCRVAVIFQDITDRKRTEAQLRRTVEIDAFRVKLSDALRPLSDSVQIQAQACRLLGEHLGVSRAYYCEVNPDGTHVTVAAHYTNGVPSIVGQYRLDDYASVFRNNFRVGQNVVIADALNGPFVPEEMRAGWQALGTQACVCVPLVKEGRFVACMTVDQSIPRQWKDDEIELLEEVADRTWAATDRARAEVALRESEEKYRSLFTSIDEGYALIELIYDETGSATDWRFLEVNLAFERLSGFTNPAGKTATELNQTLRADWLETFHRVAETGEPERFEQHIEDVDYWFDLSASRLDGDTRHVIVVFNNITDRKRAEQQLRRAALMDAFQVKLSDALRSLSDAVEVQRTASRVIGEYLEADRVYYADIEPDDEHFVIAENYVRENVPPLIVRGRLVDFGWVGEEMRAGRMVRIADMNTDPNMSESARAGFRALNITASLGLPLIKEGRWAAAFAVQYLRPHEWSEAEVKLAQETAERTWAAVERAKAEAALRESELQRVREQSEREQERQRAETLAELDRAKTIFFSNVSHEFRTPLTLLLAPLSDALNDRTLPPVHRERLELAHRNSLRLLKLVNTLLDFSRIEAGRIAAVYEPTDLATYTVELASVFHSAIERAGLRLIVDCPPLPKPVYVDRSMWEKIVLNLLSNAFKFTLEGEIAVRLHPADSQRVRLQIQDTGEGIEPEELPHLFERFYQIRGTASRTHEGSGIGLALVQELIKMHGGSVDVTSVVGVGTCFTVTLPLGTAHLPSVSVAGRDSAHRITTRTLTSTYGAAPYVEEAQQWLAAKGEPSFSILSSELNCESSTQNSKLLTRNSHVLLVDDNADMRDYLMRILSEYVQVEAVTNGAEALAAVQQTLPNLVLSDVMMPIVDGFELVKALRADARTREVPIVLLSARADEESVIEGLLAGADDYLIKPFSAVELVTRVLAHLGMAQLRSVALLQEKTISRTKDKFLAEVAHELSTPLVAILGWTRLLRSNPSNQSMLSKSLETIERNATLQAKLIEDLLDISRITAGKISRSLEPVELQAAIEGAIATVSQSLKTKDISLECLLDPLPRIVQADPNRLQQIFLNLLTNAIKFTPNGGRIEVSLKANETQAQIILTDTGCGIPAQELPYIFETFRQGSLSNKGLGLGLAIARHLVELHNGTIHAESSGVGLGATFIVGLPLQQ